MVSKNELDRGESKCRERIIIGMKWGRGGGKGEFKRYFGRYVDIIKEILRDGVVKGNWGFRFGWWRK